MLTEYKAKDYLKALKDNNGTSKIGERVKIRRKKELQISQDVLVKRIAMSKPTLIKIEKGTDPTLGQVFDLSTGLDCDPGYLLGMHEAYTYDHIDTIDRTGLTEANIVELEKRTDSIKKKKYGHRGMALEIAFINYFISKTDQFSDLLFEALRLKELEAMLETDEYKAEIIKAFEKSKERNGRSLPSDKTHYASRNMMIALKAILRDEYDTLDETELTYIAGNKARRYYFLLDGMDKRVNDFALSDSFLQTVREFVKEY